MGFFDFLSTKKEAKIYLYFKNGYLQNITPENIQDFYDCDYINSDGIQYDMSNPLSIKSISIPNFQIVDPFNSYGATGSLDYVIRMKAGKYFNLGKKELCSACLWKSTELMIANTFYGWRKNDFERLVIWHYEMKMFSEGKKAKKYLEKNGVYENQFDSIAISIKDSTFKSLNQLNTDLVAFHGYESGTCPDCAKMIGRIYSVSGKDKRFPKLPEYVKIHGNFHNGCRCTMSVYFPEMGTVYHHGEKVNALKSSNRPYEDDRTINEINAYQSYLDYLEEINNKENDRKEYQLILEKLPEIAPKSFGAYRKMKNSKTKNYEKLITFAKEIGIEIK